MTYKRITVEELLDREAIRDCLMRYCRGVDRCDADALASVYWDDGTDDHIIWQGLGSDFIPWAIGLRATVPVTSHQIGNSLFDFRGEEARVETYVWAWHRIEPGDRAPFDMELTGRYLDRFTRRGDEWRIQERVCAIDSYRELEADPVMPAEGPGSWVRPGKLKPDDYVYTFLGQ